MAKLVVPFRSSQIGDTLRPYIHIELISPITNRSMKSVAVLDTGADDCAFPAGFAEVLGIDLHAAVASTAATAGGTAVTYLQPVLMKAFADGYELSFPQCKVQFMKELHMPILGARTFLSFFKIEFDYIASEFTLHPNENAQELRVTKVDMQDYAVDQASLGGT